METLWYIVIGAIVIAAIVYRRELMAKIKAFAIKHFPWIKVLQPQIDKPPQELIKLADRDNAVRALSEENAELKAQIEKYHRHIQELEKKLKYPVEIRLYEQLDKEKNVKIKNFINNSFEISPNVPTKVMSKDGAVLGILQRLYINSRSEVLVAYKDTTLNKILWLGPERMDDALPQGFIKSMRNGVLPTKYNEQLELVPDAYIGVKVA